MPQEQDKHGKIVLRTCIHTCKPGYSSHISLRAWTFSVNRIDRPIHANTHVVNAENATWKRLKTKLLDKVRKYTHYSYGARQNTNKKSCFFLHITCSFSEMRLARKKEYTLLCYCYSYITIYIYIWYIPHYICASVYGMWYCNGVHYNSQMRPGYYPEDSHIV